LSEKDTKLYLIIDQVNVFDNLKTSLELHEILTYKSYQTLRSFLYPNITRVLVSSATNEDMVLEVNQEFPEVTIYPKYPPKCIAKKIIADQFLAEYKSQLVEDVYEITGGYFLLIKELLRFYKNKRPRTLQGFEDLIVLQI